MTTGRKTFVHEVGKADCRTQSIRDIVEFYGLKLSIPVCFGLGEGLGITYWLEKSTRVPVMVLNGRDIQTEYSLCKAINLGIQCFKEENEAAAQEILIRKVTAGQPVMMDADRYYLSYIGDRYGRTHFGLHTVIAVDCRDGYFGLYDFISHEMIWCPAAELSAARNSGWKPFAPENKWYEFNPEGMKQQLEYEDFEKAICNVCKKMLTSQNDTGLNALRSYVKTLSAFEALVNDKKGRHFLNLQVNFLSVYIGQLEASGTMSHHLYSEYLEEVGCMFDIRFYMEMALELREISQKWKAMVRFLNTHEDIQEKIQFLKIQLSGIADLEEDYFKRLLWMKGGRSNG